MSDAVSIDVRDLRREFGSVAALDGVDLDVDGPEIVGVAGPNGSGKGPRTASGNCPAGWSGGRASPVPWSTTRP